MLISEIINIGTSIILSLGGSTFLILAFSTWLGKVWANRILEKDKLRYSRELEKTKTKYEKELEQYKLELDKTKSLFFRYSESQFKLYNDLWGTLCKLKLTVEDLWIQANTQNLISFTLHLDKTINRIETHRLLIENVHYDKLKKILLTLNNFKLNKLNLIRMRLMTEDQAKSFKTSDIDNYIAQNRTSKDQFENLLEVLADDFKAQIRVDKLV